MLVLMRAATEQFRTHVAGLATDYISARPMVEGYPNVFALEYNVDHQYTCVESEDDFDSETPAIRLTDEFGTWVQF